MKRFLVFISVIFLSLFFVNGKIPVQKLKNYTQQWEKVKELQKKGLPRSALKIVDEIYKSAKKEDNNPQILKSLIYKASLKSTFEEEYLIKSVYEFEKELKTAKEPEKSILYSLLGELYQSYFSQNRYKILNRSIIENNPGDDIRVWDAKRFYDKTNSCFINSVSHKKLLKSIGLKEYSDILNIDQNPDFSLRPTLYDLLAQRAVNYFSTPDASLFDFVNTAIDTAFLVPADKFVQMDFEKTGGGSNTEILKLFQEILNLHFNNNDFAALVDADIKRLDFLRQKITGSYADKYYENALIWLAEYVKNSESMMPAAYKLASFYYNKGQVADYKKTGKQKENFYVKAEKICRNAVESYPGSEWKKAFEGLLNKIHQRSIDFKIADCNVILSPILVKTMFKNVDTVFVKIVPYKYQIDPVSWNEERKRIEKLSGYKGVYNKMYLLPSFKDFKNHSTEIIIDSLRAGHYVMFMSDNKSFSHDKIVIYKKLQVSNLTYMKKNNEDKKTLGIYVMYRNSGKPVAGAHITVYRQRFDNRFGKYQSEKTGEYICNEEGFVEIPANYKGYSNRYLFDITNGYEHFFSHETIWFWNNDNIKPVERTYFFTDRAIYRPGQTVYFKAIAVKQIKNDAEVIKNRNITVTLLDANYKKAGTLELTTNEFGSVQGSFVLPTGKLNGRFTLRSDKGSASFRVEEYKRPTFFVSFDTVRQKYKLNDIVKIKGKASGYSGNPLTGAKVRYRVTRKNFERWPLYSYYFPFPQANIESEITNGELVTNDEGTFEIVFKALPGENKNYVSDYYFTVYADVTDITGEVHSSKTVIVIGKSPYLLNIDIPGTVVRETNGGITVSAKNLSGEYVDVNATLSLYKLIPPERVMTERPWSAPDTMTVPKGMFIWNFPHLPYGNENDKRNWFKKKILSENITIKGITNSFKKEIGKLSSGQYFITVESKAENGTVIKAEKYITVFSAKSKKLPVNKVLWLEANKKSVEPGENLSFYLGSAATKTRGLFEVYANGKLIKEEWVQLSKKLKTVEIPVKEEYRGIIVAKLSTVRFNSGSNKVVTVSVPFNNKKLTVSLETKRDFLTPGKKEEWRVNIKGNNNEPVVAELLAGMYDASLDEFAVNNWKLNLYRTNRNVTTWNISGFTYANGNILFEPQTKYYSAPAIVYPRINWFGFRFTGHGYPYRSNILAESECDVTLFQRAVPVTEQKSVAPETPAPDGKQPANYDGKKEQPRTTPEKEKNEPQEFSFRTNFNETAFFYPQLHTDSSGNVGFSFTTPDALTQWKIMMIAHTADLKTGTLVEKIKAHKDLMVFPNKPRFVRSGDMLDFSGKVVNFTGKQKVAEVTISFFNPADNTPLNIIDGKPEIKLRLNLTAGKSVKFSQKITIPGNTDMLGYRIKAVSDNFTDGVEDMIPVLPGKMLVTETMPITVKGGQSGTFKFDKLINTGKTMQASAVDNYRYTVEFTSHPVWYAVQALPYLSQPRYPSANNIFNVYYSNSIASGIVNEYPQIKSVLEQWKHYSPDAFLSNLQKNKELKSVLLDATPWVLEAETETEQKRRVALLFNINNLSNNLEQSLEKLKSMQLPSGAWPWFKGMRADRYTTQKIVAGFARLQKMNFADINSDNTLKTMLEKAVNYLDNQITKDFNELKKRKNSDLKKEHITALQINWLYARSAFIDMFPVKATNRQAFDYYTEQAKRYWIKKNNYLQAMIAVSMQRLGYKNSAEAIMRSLTERSLESEDMGIYWRNESGWYWYNSPVETQVMIMEAYDEVMKDALSVEKIKIWLLKNKQTNRWRTSSATADAVFGMLMRGNDLLKETKPVSVTVGGISLYKESKPQAGTGYVKKTWMRKEIKPDLGVIKVTNPNKTVVWGAAYYQYFEKLDKISSHQTVLQVHKKYFVEKLTPQGVVVEPLKENQKLKTGQKIIVRLIVKSDRTMEYVHLKDMRAATFEPVENISGTQFKNGLMYYQNIKDASVDFFISTLPKGTFVLEYSLHVTQTGDFSSGIATIQSFYAPEFASHSQGKHIVVE